MEAALSIDVTGRLGRTSSAPNSALRLFVDKAQGLLSSILSQINLVLPSMKLKQELKMFIQMSLNSFSKK